MRRALVFVGVDHDRHARDPRLFGAADRQRIDVEGAAAEQRRHTVQHARLVFDVNDEGVQHGLFPFRLLRLHNAQSRRRGLMAACLVQSLNAQCLYFVNLSSFHNRRRPTNHLVQIGAGGNHRIHRVFLLHLEVDQHGPLGRRAWRRPVRLGRAS